MLTTVVVQRGCPVLLQWTRDCFDCQSSAPRWRANDRSQQGVPPHTETLHQAKTLELTKKQGTSMIKPYIVVTN